MPAYNFKRQFVAPIRDGKKSTTIRPIRSHRPTRVGDKLHLFTGMRTKQCERIGTYQCVGIQPITIYMDDHEIDIDGKPCSNGVIQALAHGDGFSSVKDFFEFFCAVYAKTTLHMEMITWEPLEKP